MNHTVTIAASLAAAFLAAGCTPKSPGQTPTARGARADLRDAQGAINGNVELTARGSDSTAITVRVAASAAARGVHVHAVGRCEAPGFTTAGGHLNPFAHQHGRLNPRGAHAGDLPNLPPGGLLTFVLAVPLDSILDADGSAIIVHANADDELTDPSGNSGPRILCGVVGATSGRRTAP